MKTVKRIVCLLLCVVMIMTVFVPVTANAASSLPIIYIYGNGRTIYNKQGKKIYPFGDALADALMDKKDELVDAFTKGLLRRNYTYLEEEISGIISPLFKELKLNNNGEISNGSYHKKSKTPKKKKSNYGISDYAFEYDPRIDPLESAVALRSYINSVLKATGKKKVHIVARCLGTSILGAYLCKYGKDKVDSVVFYAGSMNGMLIASAAFSGNYKIDPEGLQNYAKNNTGESDFADIANSLANVFKSSKLTSAVIQKEFTKAAQSIMPGLIMDTYGTMPAYWSLVGPEYYKAAKKFIFGANTAKYSGLIKKTDNYYNTVSLKLPETLKKLKKDGMKVYVITKYNVQLPPLFEYSNQQADGYVEVPSMSFGATCADMGKTLSASYINYLKKAGKSKYLSKDKAIDASTCLFPDNTWFIRNISHDNWASPIHTMIMSFLSSGKQCTIKSKSKYPQFLEYNEKKNTISPLKSTGFSGTTNPSVTKIDMPSSVGYTGKAVKPAATVLDNHGKALRKGEDYTVSYDSSPVEFGTYSAKVKLKGYFSGTKAFTYKILPATVTNVKAKEATTTSITLTWTKSKGVDNYTVYKYNSSNRKYTKIVQTENNTVDIDGLKPNTAYSFSVMATANAFGSTYNSSKSDPYKTGTAPSAPVIKVTKGANKATVSWSKMNCTGYKVYMSTSKKGTYNCVKTIKNSGETQYTITKLTVGKTYYFKVKAYKTYGKNDVYSSASAVKSAKISSGLSTPTLTAKAGINQITLTWNKTNGTGYILYMTTSKNGTYKRIATINKASTVKYTKKSLTPDKTYYFKIRTYKDNGSNISPASSAASAKVSRLKTPTLKAAAGNNKVTLTWNKISSATGYLLYMATGKNGTYRKIATVKGGSTVKYTKTQLSGGGTYYFKIRAYKDNVEFNSTASKAASAKVKTNIKTPTVKVTPGSKKATISWNKISGATGYLVYMASSEKGTYSKIAEIKKGTTLKYVKSSLTKGKTYYFKVRAYKNNTGTNSVSSKAVKAKIK